MKVWWCFGVAPFVRSIGAYPTEGQMVIRSGTSEDERAQSLRITALSDGSGATLEVDVNADGDYDDAVDVNETTAWSTLE
jgi:hypothetical protein